MASGPRIGSVDTAAGEVFILRAGGPRERIGNGAEIYAGDHIETGSDGQVAMTMVDGSRFSLGENGALTMDEKVYGGDGDARAASAFVAHGVFEWVSGQHAQPGADTRIVKTPVLALGIRAANLVGLAGGENGDMVTLLRDLDGHLGEVVAYNKSSAQVLCQENQTVRANTNDSGISEPMIVTASVIGDMYGAPLLGGGRATGMPIYRYADVLSPDEERAPDETSDTTLQGEDELLDAPDDELVAEPMPAFEPFKLLDDRLFERQFLDSDIYPDQDVEDGRVDALGRSNLLLEDAFVGTRYAVSADLQDDAVSELGDEEDILLEAPEEDGEDGKPPPEPT